MFLRIIWVLVFFVGDYKVGELKVNFVSWFLGIVIKLVIFIFRVLEFIYFGYWENSIKFWLLF